MSGLNKYLLCNLVLALLLAPWLCGCVTKAQADARAREAFLAGQRSAYASLGGEGQVVMVVGAVKSPNVPWVAGLTLAQAIATAEYTGRHNPKTITITRQGETISVSPQDLLKGHVVLLQPGDQVEIRE